jgi:hypothetical protein
MRALSMLPVPRRLREDGLERGYQARMNYGYLWSTYAKTCISRTTWSLLRLLRTLPGHVDGIVGELRGS